MENLPSKGFAKLDSGIVDSTLWMKNDDVLRVWIALLAKSDSLGIVRASVPAMAHLCFTTLERFETIIGELCAPDPHSRTSAHEGRRLSRIEGGWCILNYVLYREMMQRKAMSHAERQRRYRERLKERDASVTHSVTSDTEAEAEAEAALALSRKPIPQPDRKEKKEPRVKRAPLTPLPPDFGISDRVQEWADRNDYTRLSEHLEHFVTVAKARAYVYADWDAAFMTAIRKDWAGIRAPGQAQTVRPQMGKTANAISKLQGMKNGNERFDLEPDAAPVVPRIGGPARR